MYVYIYICEIQLGQQWFSHWFGACLHQPVIWPIAENGCQLDSDEQT